MFTAILVFGLTFVPYVAAHRLDIRFPWFVYFLIALSLSLHIAGYVQGWYFTYYPYYDKMAHLVSGTSIALIGFLGVIFLDRYWRMNLTPLFIVVFTVIVRHGPRRVWEIYEFAVDQVFGGPLAVPMQNSLGRHHVGHDRGPGRLDSRGLVGVLYFRKHRSSELEDSMTGHSEAEPPLNEGRWTSAESAKRRSSSRPLRPRRGPSRRRSWPAIARERPVPALAAVLLAVALPAVCIAALSRGAYLWVATTLLFSMTYPAPLWLAVYRQRRPGAADHAYLRTLRTLGLLEPGRKLGYLAGNAFVINARAAAPAFAWFALVNLVVASSGSRPDALSGTRAW